jgi:radical SAM superfamily enzyme YgiQ (UPF0313 family)
VISFFDDTIGLRSERLIKICEGFIKEKIFYPYTHLRWVGELRANQVTPELLKLMKEAGCFSIAMGIESGSDRMLQVINKKTTVDMNRRACRYVKEAGLHLGISFMMGIPTETEADMRKTIDFMKEVNCNYMGIGNFRPLPGSQFFNELVKDKENTDWVNIGNFMTPPKYKFYNCEDKAFDRLYDEAYNLAYGRQWLTIHIDAMNKYPALVKEIASSVKTKICSGTNYYSDSHKTFNPSRLIKVRSKLESVYIGLPYEIRKPLRNMIKRIAQNGFMNKFLWRYA